MRRTDKNNIKCRFEARVAQGPGCQLWMGNRNRTGYGKIKISGKTRFVHRVAYELYVGPIPGGLTIDHLCRTHACVNPSHLEPVTMKTNILRGFSPSAICARMIQCKKGHDFCIDLSTGTRRCHKCMADKQRERHYKQYKQGLCRNCNEPHDEGVRSCHFHRALTNSQKGNYADKTHI